MLDWLDAYLRDIDDATDYTGEQAAYLVSVFAPTHKPGLTAMKSSRIDDRRQHPAMVMSDRLCTATDDSFIG